MSIMRSRLAKEVDRNQALSLKRVGVLVRKADVGLFGLLPEFKSKRRRYAQYRALDSRSLLPEPDIVV